MIVPPPVSHPRILAWTLAGIGYCYYLRNKRTETVDAMGRGCEPDVSYPPRHSWDDNSARSPTGRVVLPRWSAW
jgi:hypothetical protein